MNIQGIGDSSVIQSKSPPENGKRSTSPALKIFQKIPFEDNVPSGKSSPAYSTEGEGKTDNSSDYRGLHDDQLILDIFQNSISPSPYSTGSEYSEDEYCGSSEYEQHDMAALLEAYRSGPYDTASDSDENVNEEDEIDRISERSSPLPISLTPTQVDNPISDQVLDPTVIRTEEPVLEETSTDLSPPNLPRLEDSATDQVPSDTIVVRLPPAPPKLTAEQIQTVARNSLRNSTHEELADAFVRGSPSILTSILTDERTNIHLPVTLLSKADEILLEGLENDSFSLPVSMQLRMAQNSTQRFKAMQGSPSLTKYVVDRMNRQEIVHHMQFSPKKTQTEILIKSTTYEQLRMKMEDSTIDTMLNKMTPTELYTTLARSLTSEQLQELYGNYNPRVEEA
ncbi:MAG: hypothetical protein K2Y01_10565 [Rhabdochlamydiaceae bacterium]|nr:hypothetical protein [Rhabdochlamydiaceae bacterium]